MANGIGRLAGTMASNILQGALQPLQQIQDAQAINQQASAGAQVFRQLGNPQAAQFADLLEANPRGALGVAQQFGGMQNLFGTFEQQQRQAALQQPGALAGFSPEEQQQIQALGLRDALPLVVANREQQAAQQRAVVDILEATQKADRDRFIKAGDAIAEITDRGLIFHQPQQLPGSGLDFGDQVKALDFIAKRTDKTLLPLYNQRQGMQTAIGLIEEGLNNANPTSLLAGVRTFIASIDNSVVRGEEFESFRSSLGLMKSLADQANEATGQGKLILGRQARDAAQQAIREFNAAVSSRERGIEQLGTQRFGFSPEEIRRDFFIPGPDVSASVSVQAEPGVSTTLQSVGPVQRRQVR